MTEPMFNNLLDLVKERIIKKDTVMRDAIPAKLKLEITLRFLASGDSFVSLQYLYRVPACTICLFVSEVLDSISEALKDFLKVPETWNDIIDGFSTRWNYEQCVGAIDGKHFKIRCPANSGSLYYNYKGGFNIVLLALVDHDYNFTAYDLGSYGSNNDGGIYDISKIKYALEHNTFKIPEGCVVLGDDAFPLKNYLMIPYARPKTKMKKIQQNSNHGDIQEPTPMLTKMQLIYNYRHSRVRRIVENAFGILAARFRIFEKPMHLKPFKAIKVIKACLHLHNWIRKHPEGGNSGFTFDVENIQNGTLQKGNWRNNPSKLGPLIPTKSRNANIQAKNKRNHYANFFMGEGAVPWQDNMI